MTEAQKGQVVMHLRNYGDDIAPGQHDLVVKSYSETFGCHECTFDGGLRTVFVDLFVNGDLPENLEPNDLIGKTVQVNYTHGFIWLADGVRVIDADSQPSRSQP